MCVGVSSEGWRVHTFIQVLGEAFFFPDQLLLFLTEWIKLTVVVSWKPNHGNLIETSGD